MQKSLGWSEAIGFQEEIAWKAKKKLVKRPARIVHEIPTERPAFECDCLIHSRAGGFRKKRAATAGSGEQS